MTTIYLIGNGLAVASGKPVDAPAMQAPRAKIYIFMPGMLSMSWSLGIGEGAGAGAGFGGTGLGFGEDADGRGAGAGTPGLAFGCGGTDAVAMGLPASIASIIATSLV